MKCSEFKKIIYGTWGCDIYCLHGKYDKNVFQQIKKLKESTSEIDFECEFNSDGSCKTELTVWGTSNKRCCCKHCGAYTGYLHVIPSDYYLRYYAKRFDKDLGFWREGVGCILDRSMRSRICVTYTCIYRLKPKLNELYDKIHHLESKLVGR